MGKEFKKMHYINGHTLSAEDYTLDKELHKRLRQLHNRYLHTYGIASGLEVKSVIDSSMEVFVTEGVAFDLIDIIDPETKKISESLSREILIYDGHPDNPVDLSEYSAGESIYIYVSYKEVLANLNTEKGQGEKIHIWELGTICHDTEKPTNCKENIILARIEPREATKEEMAIYEDTDAIIDSTCIFDTDKDGTPLRVYAGPYAKVMELERFIFKLGEETEKMPFITSFNNDNKEIQLETNSLSTFFTDSMNIKGDVILESELVWKSSGDTQKEFKFKDSVLQVNSTSKGNEDKWKPRDGGFEVYRGGPGVAPDARLLWSNSESVWKVGTGNDLYNIGGGREWKNLATNIKNPKITDLYDCKDLHQHQGLYSSKGSILNFESNGNLSVNGELAINDFQIKWEKEGASGGIGWFGENKLFKNVNVNGPVLYGYRGGMLGVTQGGQKSALSWNSTGNVGIGSIYSSEDMLDVDGNIRILEGLNPMKFTSEWSGFPDSTINRAEISNDINNYRGLMIVGNQSSGQGRKVAIWDRLDVGIVADTKGFLYVNGNMNISTSFTLSPGNKNNGIIFPPDPGGGSSDSAWLKYYPISEKNYTLEIGTSNDRDDHISFMPSGGVGIGTNLPTEKLVVCGNTRLMNGTNPIKFTSSWSGFPDKAANQAEISNDTSNYKTLKIVGNKSSGQGRKVTIWDKLEVKGSLEVKGNGIIKIDGVIVPSANNSGAKGIMFPNDPSGGSGDAAWIRYYSDTTRGGGENMTLEIGINNDDGIELIQDRYWHSYCSWCSSESNNRYGCGHWHYVLRSIRGIKGDRMRLFASGGVYIEGYFYYTSSREYKENIKKLCQPDIQSALDGLEPVEYNFKGDYGRRTIGFIAGNTSNMFSANDSKAINPMEIITALVSEVKDQENSLNQLKKKVAALKNAKKNKNKEK